MLSAAASLGTILLWDVDGGLTQIDKYLYSSEDYIKVSAADPSLSFWPCGVGCVCAWLPLEGLDASQALEQLTARLRSSRNSLEHFWGPFLTELQAQGC